MFHIFISGRSAPRGSGLSLFLRTGFLMVPGIPCFMIPAVRDNPHDLCVVLLWPAPRMASVLSHMPGRLQPEDFR